VKKVKIGKKKKKGGKDGFKYSCPVYMYPVR